MAAATSLTAEQRVERARNAGKAAHTLASHVGIIVSRWPELTPEQKAVLRALLRGGK